MSWALSPMRDSIPWPWDHELSWSQESMLNQTSHPKCPDSVSFKRSLSLCEQWPTHLRCPFSCLLQPALHLVPACNLGQFCWQVGFLGMLWVVTSSSSCILKDNASAKRVKKALLFWCIKPWIHTVHKQIYGLSMVLKFHGGMIRGKMSIAP